MNVGRVTHGSMTLSSLNNLQSTLGKLAAAQEQVTTGRRINRPSDDPTDAARAMRTRTSLADHEQVVRNTSDAVTWMNLTDNTLQSVNTSLRRVRDLALQGANGTNGATSLEALALEVEQIRDELLGTANTKYLDRPIFGGVTAGSEAFDASGTFVGTTGDVTRTIASGVSMTINSDGASVFGSGATSMFAELDTLANAIRSGDATAVAAGIGVLDQRVTKVVDEMSAVGARTNRAEGALAAAKDAILSLSNSVSEIENVEMAKAFMEVQMHEVSYQAALSATSRVIQPSLVDFLR